MRDDWVEQDAWDDGYSHGYDDAEQRIAELEAQVARLQGAVARLSDRLDYHDWPAMGIHPRDLDPIGGE